ncbi:E3 ubiquitin-protein ligase KCMF1-like isoform X1 [Tachypleus tridentatus]|uniref:E3 ubiquitin-protein ligase KCMF1-like isoform X1 n=2 Tax=Tachypleus tridentatus TaxID=6853 RepID=UPI003FD601A5
MSRHEGVSCDSCLKGNFKGKRYKCLICHDYDLCATCYEAGTTSNQHTTDHPMQCILTRSDFDVYYGGEAISVDQPQSFTCPYCGKLGFTEGTLQEHVSSEHSDSSFEVVCPVCAASPSGEPNNITDDFAAHLTLEHRNPRELDETTASRHVRRIPHPGRGMSSARARRNQMQFSPSSALSSLSPSSRESINPLAELLSQLSGVRRAANLSQTSTTSQLQQLQIQLQLERQQAQSARQQQERIPRKQNQTGAASSGGAPVGSTVVQFNQSLFFEPTTSPSSSTSGSQFVLSRFTESEQQTHDVDRAHRILFIQELLLTTLASQLSLSDDWDSIDEKLGLRFDNCTQDENSSNTYLALAGEDLGATSVTSDVSSHHSTLSVQLHQQRHPVSSALPSQTNQQANLRTQKKSSSSISTRQSSHNTNNGINYNQSLRDATLQQPSLGSRAGSNSVAHRVPSREGLAYGRMVNRNPGREGGTSPSSTNRKVLRHVDDRNKSNEPPPPH